MKCASRLVVSIVLLLLMGCRQENAKDDILVVVNKHPLTAEMVRTAVKIEAKMAELSGRAIPRENFDVWANNRALQLVPEIVSTMLVCQDARRCKVKPTTNDLATVLGFYNKQAKQNAKTKEELAAKFGDLSAAFARQFEDSLSLTAYRRLNWNFKANDLLVKDHIRRMDEQRKKADAIDKTAKARAALAYERLQKGERWEKVADEMSEDRLSDSNREKFSSFWRCVGKDAMNDKDFAKYLKEIQIGDYTPPMEMQDGMVIARLVAKQHDIFKMARIYFRMALEVPKYKSDAEARKDMEDQINRVNRENTLKQLQKEAAFEFPKGTNFVYTFWGTQK